MDYQRCLADNVAAVEPRPESEAECHKCCLVNGPPEKYHLLDTRRERVLLPKNRPGSSFSLLQSHCRIVFDSVPFAQRSD